MADESGISADSISPRTLDGSGLYLAAKFRTRFGITKSAWMVSTISIVQRNFSISRRGDPGVSSQCQ